MNDKDRVAVCSRSFSANEELRREILSRYKHKTVSILNKNPKLAEPIAYFK